MNQAFQYQRLVLGYHGCDKFVADRVLMGNDILRKSEKSYDWLGSGIYFWEHGPERALDWAKDHARRGKIKTPAVLGAVIHLGNCLDMMDTQSTSVLADAFPRFRESRREIGQEIPENSPSQEDDADLVLRHLDCSVINWLTGVFDLDPEAPTYDSVRGLF